MELNNLTSLHQFNLLVKHTISSLQGYKTDLNTNNKSFDENRSGWYFSLNKINTDLIIVPWLGIYYCGVVSIYMEFNSKICNPVFEGFKKYKSVEQGNVSFNSPHINEEYSAAIIYSLKDDVFAKLANKATPVEEQRRIIRIFVNEVLKDVEAYFKWQMTSPKDAEQQILISQKEMPEKQVMKQRVKELEQSIEKLKSGQAQAIQQAKMVSLGELTAGISHEIKNPLNMVINLSEVTIELLEEATEEINAGKKEAAVGALQQVKENLQKVVHEGKRADAIAQGMLQHSNGSTGEKQ